MTLNHHQKHIAILVYYSLKDPLCEGLMLSYLKALKDNYTVFHLITYEQKKYELSLDEIRELKIQLLNEFNIVWYPMRYTTGRFFLIKKATSALSGINLIRKINQKNPLKLICGMATLAGTFAFMASRLLKIKYCQFTYEPHSLIMMESGKMSATSIRFKIARYFESKIGLQSEYVACTTRHMVDDLRKLGARGKLYRIPTSVDEEVNRFSESARARIRKELGLTSEPLLIYPGKFGGMYRQRETISLLSEWLKLYPTGHVLIITDFDLKQIQAWFREIGTDEHKVHIRGTVPLKLIPEYLSASDLGLIAYENFDSRKYCSPVKTGEFLMCGIPYLVQVGTSEDDEIAEKYGVGAVMPTFDASGLLSCKPQMDQLLGEDKITQRNRCRLAGENYRGKRNALQSMREIFNTC